MLTTIPETQTVATLVSKVGLSRAEIESVLRKLENWKLVKHEGGTWKATSKSLHIDRSHYLFMNNHENLRNLNRQKLQQNASQSDVVYGALYTMSTKDAAKIREALVEMIRWTREVTMRSPSEDMVGLTVEFVKV